MISETSYERGLHPLVAARFQTGSWGWHVVTAEHFIHLVLSGVFDRYPELQVILGHWGELDRTFTDYFTQNVYITPSGMWNQARLQYCVQTLGVDRIIYAVDYPFLGNEGAVSFLAEANLSTEDKNKIAHTTAEKLLGL